MNILKRNHFFSYAIAQMSSSTDSEGTIIIICYPSFNICVSENSCIMRGQNAHIFYTSYHISLHSLPSFVLILLRRCPELVHVSTHIGVCIHWN